MLLTCCKAKISHAKVTQAELYYEGSITIDSSLIQAVGILPGEKVEVLNVNNGIRLETYVIAGQSGSGQICLNGPAARLGFVGDSLIIICYAQFTEEEAKTFKMKTINLDHGNRIKT